MDINGKTRLFSNEFGYGDKKRIAYSTSIGRKNKDGEWDRMYVPVKFIGKGGLYDPHIADGTDITISNGFLSFYSGKNGQSIEYIVKEFAVEGGAVEKAEKQEYRGFTEDEVDSIPF